jgi:hypothetical protein
MFTTQYPYHAKTDDTDQFKVESLNLYINFDGETWGYADMNEQCPHCGNDSFTFQKMNYDYYLHCDMCEENFKANEVMK